MQSSAPLEQALLIAAVPSMIMALVNWLDCLRATQSAKEAAAASARATIEAALTSRNGQVELAKLTQQAAFDREIREDRCAQTDAFLKRVARREDTYRLRATF